MSKSRALIASLTDDHAAAYLVAVDREAYIRESILKPAALEHMNVEIIAHVLNAKLKKAGINHDAVTQESRTAGGYQGFADNAVSAAESVSCGGDCAAGGD